MKKVMMMAFLGLSAISILTSCGGGEVQKKVVIMGRGEIKVNGNEITNTGGSGYAEKTVEITEPGAVAWTVDNAGTKTTVNIPEEKGTYILNLKTDTVVGSRQNIGTDLTGSRTITQEEIKVIIDSLTQLTTGANITLGGRNYMIVPGQLIKISATPRARIYGPFDKIPGALDPEPDGSEPELYKFYTNAGMRERIQTFTDMTH